MYVYTGKRLWDSVSVKLCQVFVSEEGAGAESKGCDLLFSAERQLMAGHRNSGSGSGGGPRALLAQCLPHPLSCGASSCRNLHPSARSGVHSCIDESAELFQTVNNVFNETKRLRYF